MRAGSAKFMTDAQIRQWHREARPQGRVSVLKRVERDRALIIEITRGGKTKIKMAMFIAEERN